ncbi:MAG: helix-turn-helix domain-containing protein [Endozoicomonas sp.]
MAYTLCLLGFAAGWLFRANASTAPSQLLVKHKFLVLLILVEVAQLITALSRSWAQEAHFAVAVPFMFAYWLKGPLLYFYCRDILGQPLRLHSALHLLPFLLMSLTAQWHAEAYMLMESHPWWQVVNITGSNLDLFTVFMTLATLVVLGAYCFSCKELMMSTDTGDMNDSDLALMKAACHSQILVTVIASVMYLLLPMTNYGQPFSITLTEGLTITTLVTLGVMMFSQRRMVLLLRNVKLPSLSGTGASGSSAPGLELPADSEKLTEAEASALFQLVQKTIESSELFTNPELRQSDVARAVGLPTSQLSHVVNRCSDGNYSDLIHQYRVRHAHQMIERLSGQDQAFNFKQIARASGYKSHSSFFTQFKRIYGVTPGSYLKQLNNTAKPMI